MAFLPTKRSCKLLLAVALLGLASSHVLAFIALPGGSGVVGRSALLPRSGNVPPVFSRPLQRSPHDALEEKGLLVESLLEAKRLSGKTYDEIADEMGLTNTYVAQLFLNQAQLQPNRVDALSKAVPELGEPELEAMQQCPYRSFDEEIRDEPLVYRLLEAVLHYGEGLKSIVNEKFGDGIMSAIDFYLTVDKIKGSQGEDRVVITFNGKFLPFIEQTKEGAAFGVGVGEEG